MKLKFLNTLIIYIIAIIFVVLLAYRGFVYWFWSEWNIDRTLNIFQRNRNSYHALVTWAEARQAQSCIEQKGSKQCLDKQFKGITNKYISISYNPLIVEAAPISFYYVLVYTKHPTEVKKSGVYQDEGKILQVVEQNWTLVRRGWM
jgi:flagellar basal body-associated protein FliL